MGQPESYTTEWFLCNYFEPWKPETLEAAIKTNFVADIAQFGDQIVNHVRDQFIAWAKTYRPDLHKILIKPEGRQWVKTIILAMLRQIH